VEVSNEGASAHLIGIGVDCCPFLVLLDGAKSGISIDGLVVNGQGIVRKITETP
jgi:hypothetical protein